MLYIRLRRLAAAVLLSALLLSALSGCGSTSRQDSEFSDGITRIQALESADPAQVDAAIKEYHRQELIAQRDERLAQLDSGELSAWELFEDYVILGDSRAAGFKFLYKLDNDRNFAEYGYTIRTIPDYYEDIAKYNPSYIFLIFGLNDMVQEGFETPEGFVTEYKAILEELQSRFPNAKIFVNSIFPCTEPAFSTRWEKWRETQEYSDALEEMVATTSAYFISNDNVTDFTPYWNDDGIHFNSAFYDIWAKNMIMAIYDAEIGLSDFDDSYDSSTDTGAEAASGTETATADTDQAADAAPAA